MEQKTLFAVAVMEQCLFKKIFKKITFIPFLHSHLLWNTQSLWLNSIIGSILYTFDLFPLPYLNLNKTESTTHLKLTNSFSQLLNNLSQIIDCHRL